MLSEQIVYTITTQITIAEAITGTITETIEKIVKAIAKTNRAKTNRTEITESMTMIIMN